MNQLVESNENREKVMENLINYQEKMKLIFDQKSKDILFQPRDLVLRWDVRKEEKGKHGKFDHFWFGPFKIAKVKTNNTFILENLDDELIQLRVNG